MIAPPATTRHVAHVRACRVSVGTGEHAANNDPMRLWGQMGQWFLPGAGPQVMATGTIAK